MLATKLVRGMQWGLGCALLLGGLYFSWEKRAEFSAMKPEQTIGAAAYNSKIEAIRMIMSRNVLSDPLAHRKSKVETKLSQKSEAKGGSG